MNTRLLALGLAITAAWAALFRVGVVYDAAIEALSFAAVLAVIIVVRAAPQVRDMLRPRARDAVIGVVFGAVTVLATVVLYPHVRDLALVPGLAVEVKRFYGIVPFTLVVVPLIVLVAAAEELIWRGLFLAALPKGAVAIGMGAVAYALGQLGGSAVLGGAALFFGVLWGVEAKLTKGLVAPLITHVIWTASVFGIWPLER